MGDSDVDADGEYCPVELLGANSSQIHRRIGHVAVKYKDFIIVWGGYTEEEKRTIDEYYREDRYHPPDEVLLFDIEYEIWHRVHTGGNAPPKLCGCTAAVSGDSMYLFGGFSEEPFQESSNVRSLYELNLEQMSWKQIWAAGIPPLPCDKLVSWCYKDEFYVFGGFGPWPDHVGDYPGLRVEALPGAERCWNSQLVRLSRSGAGRRWEWLEADGDGPSPRAAHAAAIVGSRVFVFGGRMGRRLNDLYCLELEAMCWTKLEPSDQLVPEGRSWHSLTPVLDNQLLLYGGFNDQDQSISDPWLWDIASHRWSPCPWLSLPPVRMWHAAATGAAGEVLVVGGLASSIFTRELCASHVVFVRRSPKTLLRMCLDVVEEHRSVLTPDVWLLPSPVMERVMARLTAAGPGRRQFGPVGWATTRDQHGRQPAL